MSGKKKRWICVALILMMILGLAGCGAEKKDPSEMHVAMITDASDITDQSFNQQIYEACRDFCQENRIDFTYKNPEKTTLSDRVAMIDLAVAEGYNVIICFGNGFNKTISVVTRKYPDVKFVAGDVTEEDLIVGAVGNQYYDDPSAYALEEVCYTDNLYIANYQTEISAFCAGYAAVKSGYRRLGFLGGRAVSGVIRYGYGYLHGIDAAAKELGISEEVEVEYAYSGQFFGSAEITAVMDTWYSTGTEIVFACGGAIYTSVAESAAKYKGKMIGVDLDQADLIDRYGKGMTYSSALKRLDVTIDQVLSGIQQGHWDQFKGKNEMVGLFSGMDMDRNAVGLPVKTTQWNEAFTLEDYQQLIKKIYDGEIVVDGSTSLLPEVSFKLKQRKGTIL